jgi:hypothetical protein
VNVLRNSRRGSATDAWGDDVVQLHRDEEGNPPVGIEDAQQGTKCVERLRNYDATLIAGREVRLRLFFH